MCVRFVRPTDLFPWWLGVSSPAAVLRIWLLYTLTTFSRSSGCVVVAHAAFNLHLADD